MCSVINSTIRTPSFQQTLNYLEPPENWTTGVENSRHTNIPNHEMEANSPHRSVSLSAADCWCEKGMAVRALVSVQDRKEKQQWYVLQLPQQFSRLDSMPESVMSQVAKSKAT